MTDLMDRVRAGLGDRYHLVRELGRGGMAVVYLAYDVRHDRQVAIKVLQPELAHLIGTERFLREIRVAANLTHPNILPLHDSGEVDGLLYYIMPYIEGESLKERLSREGTLPVADAVRITRQIAGALQYAHERGVVHRDIKPANILIAGDQVVLADFGIARAVDTAPTDGLTGTGVAIGTPAYMSPEQVTGGEVDGRSDLYGLACMLYEMLTGDPPFSAATTQGVMSRQAVDRLPRIAKEHGVPRSVEIAIEKAMAKAPADRFRNGTEFAAALDTAPTLTATLAGLVKLRSGRRLAAALGLVIAVVGSAFLGSRLLGGDPPAADLDAQAVAVLPFRVGSGATASRHGQLANDVPQLLYERLPGEGGPRAVLPVAVASALERAGLSETRLLSPAEAAEIAIDVGAGQMLLGTVVGAGDRIMLTATLYDATRGAELARAETASRPLDSLLALVDELAAELLSRQAGVAEHALPALLSTQLPALRAYLAGQSEYAAGRYGSAAALFNQALDHDTTFALAGLSLLLIRDWAPTPTWARAIDAAWNHRERLSERDQRLVEAVLGSRYPAQPSSRESLDAWERVVTATPERTVAWYELGDLRFRIGALVGLSDPLDQAARAFERALESDPEHARALEGRFEIAILTGDTAAIREYGDRFFAAQTDPDIQAFHRWRMAVATEDTASLREIRARFPRLPTEVLDEIVFRAQLDGVGMEDADRAARIIEESAGQEREQRDATHVRRFLLLNRGRPGEAAAVPWRLRSTERGEREAWNRLHRVLFVLYWGSDATGLAPPSLSAFQPAPRVDPDPFGLSHYEACASGLLFAGQGNYDAAGQAIEHLRAVPGVLGDLSSSFIEVCAAMLDAGRAHARGRPDAREKVQYLDSLMVTGPEGFAPLNTAANLTVARLFDELGDPARALAAIRRRRNDSRGVPLLSTMVREEGRLAEAAGDVEGAIDAYRHYLALRYDPEPEVADEVAAVQERLGKLLESRGPASSEP